MSPLTFSPGRGGPPSQAATLNVDIGSLVHDIPVGLYRSAPDGRILYANRTLARMLGVEDPLDLLARNLETGPYEPSYSRQEFRRRLENDGEAVGIESLWRRADGQELYVRESARAIRDGRGRIQWYEGVIEDVTAEHRARRRLEIQYEIVALLAGADRLDDVFEHILPLISETGNWHHATMWMPGADGRLHCHAFWLADDVASESFTRATRESVFGPGEGMPGRVWRSGNPVWVADIVVEPAFQRAPEAADAGLRSAYLHPVAGEGVFEFLSRSQREPDEETKALLDATGQQIAAFVRRQRLDADLRASEARKDAVVRSAFDCIVTIDPQGRITEFNPAAEQTFGHRRQDVLGRPLADVVIPERYRAAHEAGLERVAREGAARMAGKRLDFEALRADGTEFPVELTIAELRTPDGIAGFAGFVRDVTERRRARQALQRTANVGRVQAHVARALAECEPTVRAVVDTAVRVLTEQLGDGCVLRVADPAAERFDLGAFHHVNEAITAKVRPMLDGAQDRLEESILGRALLRREPIFVPELTPEWVEANVAPESRGVLDWLRVGSVVGSPMTARGRNLGAVAVLRAPDQEPFTAADLSLVEGLATRVALAIDRARVMEQLQDQLTRAEAAEREVRALNEELEQRVRDRTADLHIRNRELEAFSYTVSHDLRAPLRTIDGFTRAFEEDYADAVDEEGRQLLARVRAGVHGMGRMIDGLLDLAQVSRTEITRSRVDLSALAREVVERLRAAEPDRDVEVHIAEGLPADADPTLVHVALDNLLRNAWKFTRHRAKAWIEVGSTDRDGSRAYYVRDNGAGFDMAQAGQLFRAFHRLHATSQFEGSGIGLATVQRIVHRHGGQVWAEGEVDKGATFTFTLG